MAPAICVSSAPCSFMPCSRSSWCCCSLLATRAGLICSLWPVFTCAQKLQNSRTARFSLWATPSADTHSNIWPPASLDSGSCACFRSGSLPRNDLLCVLCVSAFRFLLFVDDAAGNDCGSRRALESAVIKRGIAGFTLRFLHMVGPRVIRRENSQVRGLPRSDLSFDAQHARRARREKLHHPHQRNSPALHQLFQRQRQRRLESQNPERRAIELHIFQGRLVRGVVGGDGVDRPVGKSSQQRFPVLPRR